MPCTPTRLANGALAIVCSRNNRKAQNLCKCGRRATLECDWPEPQRNSGTCDNPICTGCATSTKDGKDYCPFHHGQPPVTQAELDLAGADAAAAAAKILGVKR